MTNLVNQSRHAVKAAETRTHNPGRHAVVYKIEYINEVDNDDAVYETTNCAVVAYYLATTFLTSTFTTLSTAKTVKHFNATCKPESFYMAQWEAEVAVQELQAQATAKLAYNQEQAKLAEKQAKLAEEQRISAEKAEAFRAEQARIQAQAAAEKKAKEAEEFEAARKSFLLWALDKDEKQLMKVVFIISKVEAFNLFSNTAGVEQLTIAQMEEIKSFIKA